MNLSGQEALLYWCKLNTSGYVDVMVQNFHSSWRDGLALCALIHKFHPEALQYDSLSKDKPLDNLEVALSEAAKLGVPRLFDPSDMLIEPKPDQRSVMTYLSQMYHVFEKNTNPGMGIANISMVGPTPQLNSSQSENNLTQHQASSRPKFSRSVSLSNLPKPASSGPSLQLRNGQPIPPLLTKTGTFKYTPAAKKAPAQSLAQEQQPLPTEPLPTDPPPLAQEKPQQAENDPPSPLVTPPVDVVPLAPAPDAIHLNAASNHTDNSMLTKTPPIVIPTTNGVSNKILSTSAPVGFPRSTTSPNISLASLLAASQPTKSTTVEVPATRPHEDSAPKPAVITFNHKPIPVSASPSPISPSPSPVPPSPSPSPTPQKTVVKVLNHKSAGEITIAKKMEDDKSPTKQASTPPIQNRREETKLQRSQSVTNVKPKNWVNTIKSNSNFIKIDPSKVEIKKVEEREGPPGDGSDDENKNSSAPRFKVDKVSSSSRSTWVAKRQKREEEEEEDEDEYEYVDNDPNRKYEPKFDLCVKLESCLMRSSSTGKLTIPSGSRDRNLKKVSFKDELPEQEDLPQIPQATPSMYASMSAPMTAPISAPMPEEPIVSRDTVGFQMQELQRARDAAVFHADEMAAKYTELEKRWKEECAANDAMVCEKEELHKKLAAVQEQTAAKFAQQVQDMTQKIADKDREILRLRMQNTTMKKKVEERDRDIEKLKITSRSFSPPPELNAVEDLESDNECRQTWENAERQQDPPPKVISVHSYGGLKISVEASKIMAESPRSATASPRFDLVKNYADHPFSPDLIRRTSTPPLAIKANTPTKVIESPQIEMAKVTSHVYIRPHTPTKPGDNKYVARPNTPTKVEIIKKSSESSSHARSSSQEQLQRADSQSKLTFQIGSPKSPEPVKIVLSPKVIMRNNSVSVEVLGSNKSGDTTPGTPRIYGDSVSGLDPKASKSDDPKTVDPAKTPEAKPEYRPGTLRSEASKPSIIFSPPSSPSPGPSPRPSPSPSPSKTPAKYTPPIRHNSNPHSSNPSPISPRASSNPSPSTSAPSYSIPSSAKTYPLRSASSASTYPSQSPSPSPNPSPVYSPAPSPIYSPAPTVPSPIPVPSPSPNSSQGSSSSASTKDHHTSKAAAIFSFITRGRSNTLPSELPGFSPDANGTHHAPVSLMSPRGPKAEASALDTIVEEKPMPITRIGRSYSLSSITPPKVTTSSPSHIPTASQAQVDTKPTWLVNLGRKIKPDDNNTKEATKSEKSEQSEFSTQETYTLDQLMHFLKTNESPSASFDKTKAEWYLNDEIFKKLFTVSKAEYGKFAKWKQDNLKRKCKMDTL